MRDDRVQYYQMVPAILAEVSVRFLITDFSTYSGTVGAWYYQGSCIGNDYISETYRTFFVRGGRRVDAIDRIYLTDERSYGITFGR